MSLFILEIDKYQQDARILYVHLVYKPCGMTPRESLHYAIGEIAYAIAKADGRIQKEERQQFLNIVSEELENHKDDNFDISDIIFRILEKDKSDTESAYKWAMEQIQLNSHYLSPELKAKFITVVERMAKACAPVTVEEQNILDRFRTDIAPIHGDPVYYNT